MRRALELLLAVWLPLLEALVVVLYVALRILETATPWGIPWAYLQ